MSDCISPVSDFGNVQEAVCVSVQKIMDACRDQNCSENVPVYLTAESQEILENATSVKARTAELLYADVDVEPVPYQDGYYCVDVQYYYRVIADAVTCGVKPVTIYGLATTCARAMLYGGEGTAQTFSSSGGAATAQPVGVVEAVDPVILCARIAEGCRKPCHSGGPGGAIGPGGSGSPGGSGGPGGPGCPGGSDGVIGPIGPIGPRSGDGERRHWKHGCCRPQSAVLEELVEAAFDDALVFDAEGPQLQVTLGQFSLVRLERETQLLIPSYDYCVPSKECSEGCCGCPEDPCEAFARMSFPVSEFFPAGEDRTLCREDEGGEGCGCGCGENRREREEARREAEEPAQDREHRQEEHRR